MPKKSKSKQKKNVEKEVKKEVLGTLQRSAGKTPMRANLANMSYYLKSLWDPVNYPGVKIPDPVSLPSATSQCCSFLQVTVNAQGVAGFYFVFGALSASTGFNATASSATSGSLTWGALSPKTYYATMSSSLQMKRLVSACVIWEYQGSPLNRKGRCIMDFEPPGSDSTSQPTASSNLMFRPYATDVSVGDRTWGIVRYIPQDTTWSAYTQPASAYGYCSIIIDGATANDIVEFTYVENYEFVPANTLLNLIEVTPSISDPLELSIAHNAITTNPDFPVVQSRKDPKYRDQVSGLAAMKVHSSVDTHHTGREPTMLESILSGITSALPVAEKVVKSGVAIAGTLAPLLL